MNAPSKAKANPTTTILAAAGTGGHVYPALAVYRELKARGLAAKLFTDRRGLRFTDGFAQEDIYVIPSGGLVTGSPLKRLSGLWQLGQGWLASRRLIKQLDVAGVIGLGGYGSVPPIVAAHQLGLPTMLKQGDAVLGRANRFVANRVRKVCLGFPDTKGIPPHVTDKVEVVGAPLRPDIEALAAQDYQGPGDKISILCVGGSLGAKAFADILPKAFQHLGAAKCSRLTVVQQVTDIDDRRALTKRYNDLGLEADIVEYVHDMPKRLAACDLVIARSGSTTVHESAVAGRASIFIPLGIHADAQQKHNARYLANAGAAWIVEQNDSAASSLAEILGNILDMPQQLTQKATAARSMAILGSAARIADLAQQEFNIP